MTKAKVIFNFEGVDVTIQCSKEEPMKDICQKYVNKIDKNINSLIFLYGGNQLNFNLNFNQQANSLDKERNIMKILVYKNEDNECICPKCGEKIKFNTEKIDDIILSINNSRDAINSIKFSIDNIIKISSDNFVNIQLKSVNVLLNTLNEDIKKINEKLNNLLNNNKIKNENINLNINNVQKGVEINKLNLNQINNTNNKNLGKNDNLAMNDFNSINKGNLNNDTLPKEKYENSMNNNINQNQKLKDENINNYIIAEIDIKEKDINKDIRILNSHEEAVKNGILNNDKVYNNEEEIKKCEIRINDQLIPFNYIYKFKSSGKYTIKYTFKNNINNTSYMFYKCELLTNIDLSNFNTDKVTNMFSMFLVLFFFKKYYHNNYIRAYI